MPEIQQSLSPVNSHPRLLELEHDDVEKVIHSPPPRFITQQQQQVHAQYVHAQQVRQVQQQQQVQQYVAQPPAPPLEQLRVQQDVIQQLEQTNGSSFGIGSLQKLPPVPYADDVEQVVPSPPPRYMMSSAQSNDALAGLKPLPPVPGVGGDRYVVSEHSSDPSVQVEEEPVIAVGQITKFSQMAKYVEQMQQQQAETKTDTLLDGDWKHEVERTDWQWRIEDMPLDPRHFRLMKDKETELELVHECRLACSVKQFYDTFLADNAQYPKQWDEVDVKMKTNWTWSRDPNMIPRRVVNSICPCYRKNMITNHIRIPGCPPKTRMLECWWLYQHTDKIIRLCTEGDAMDPPMGQSMFSVSEWTIRAIDSDSCIMSIKFGVCWRKGLVGGKPLLWRLLKASCCSLSHSLLKEYMANCQEIVSSREFIEKHRIVEEEQADVDEADASPRSISTSNCSPEPAFKVFGFGFGKKRSSRQNTRDLHSSASSVSGVGSPARQMDRIFKKEALPEALQNAFMQANIREEE